MVRDIDKEIREAEIMAQGTRRDIEQLTTRIESMESHRERLLEIETDHQINLEQLESERRGLLLMK